MLARLIGRSHNIVFVKIATTEEWFDLRLNINAKGKRNLITLSIAGIRTGSQLPGSAP